MEAQQEHSSEGLKVFGLGLTRTGTKSLKSALEILGFGPCHHAMDAQANGNYYDWNKPLKVTRDGASREFLDDLYQGYTSAVDWPTSIIAKSLYDAYPTAKYILTVRDPTQWVESMRKTTFKRLEMYCARESRIAAGTATEEDYTKDKMIKETGWLDWIKTVIEHYHQNRLLTDPEGEMMRHNEYIKQLIPPEKLLVYNIAEGWDPLVNFLIVPKPSEPFPWLNDSKRYETNFERAELEEFKRYANRTK